MEELKTCALCGKEMRLNAIHLCGDLYYGKYTLIHTCIDDIQFKIQADTPYGVANKWDTLMTVIMK